MNIIFIFIFLHLYYFLQIKLNHFIGINRWQLSKNKMQLRNGKNIEYESEYEYDYEYDCSNYHVNTDTSTNTNTNTNYITAGIGMICNSIEYLLINILCFCETAWWVLKTIIHLHFVLSFTYCSILILHYCLTIIFVVTYVYQDDLYYTLDIVKNMFNLCQHYIVQLFKLTSCSSSSVFEKLLL